ncbi:MAG: c-type cytochrome [Thermodesulfobacteriota bacterium]
MTLKTLLASSLAAPLAAALVLATPGPAAPSPPTPDAMGRAGELYGFYCAQCHGLAGRGDGPNAMRNMPADPRDFTDPYGMSGLSDEDIVKAIADGVGGLGKSTLMPPFGATLSTEEIVELKDYLRKLCNCPER